MFAEEHTHETTGIENSKGLEKCWCGEFFKAEPKGLFLLEIEFDNYQKKKKK